MDVKGRSSSNSTIQSDEDMMDLRRGPWTIEEDLTLINYITQHGEGRWNSLARCAGLKRTGKSCRLRWLNYLRPDVRRGNITLEEQLLILELHSRWGNRWSKIAQYLPGRTDNEIKNYWRTRVQKHAKQLKCDVNSKQFKDTMKYLWMPRLMERIQAAAAGSTPSTITTAATTTTTTINNQPELSAGQALNMLPPPPTTRQDYLCTRNNFTQSYTTPENSTSSDSFGTQVSPVSDLTDHYPIQVYDNLNPDYLHPTQELGFQESIAGFSGYNSFLYGGSDVVQAVDQINNPYWLDGGDTSDSLWNVDNSWCLQQQLNPSIM